MLPLKPLSTAALIATTVALGTALSACGADSSSKTQPSGSDTALDTPKVELAIAESIQKQRKVTANVACPDSVAQAKGVSFVCDAVTKSGTTAFVVTQKDDKGNVTYVAAKDEQSATADPTRDTKTP